MRFKLDGEVGISGITFLGTGESGGGRSEINTCINGQVCVGIDLIHLENVLKYHLRHAALAPAENVSTFYHIPVEVFDGSPAHEEISGALGQLRKVHRVVLGTLQVCIYGRFTSHKADVCLACEQCRHGLVCPIPGHEFEVDPLIRKISLLDGNIHWRVEDGMCDFVQRYFFGRAVGSGGTRCFSASDGERG